MSTSTGTSVLGGNTAQVQREGLAATEVPVLWEGREGRDGAQTLDAGENKGEKF